MKKTLLNMAQEAGISEADFILEIKEIFASIKSRQMDEENSSIDVDAFSHNEEKMMIVTIIDREDKTDTANTSGITH